MQVWVGTGCQKITDDLSSIPESLPVTNKDLSDLASIRSIPQVTGLFGQMESGSYYYKRVTFLTCAMPCDFRHMPGKQGLAGFGFNQLNDPGNWVMWVLVFMNKCLGLL